MTNHRTIQPDARKVIVGVDTHKHVHVAVAIDTWGIRLGDRSCTADSDGYQQLITWAERHGRVAAFGIEGTGSYGAGLARAVRRAGHQVLERIVSGVTMPATCLRTRRPSWWPRTASRRRWASVRRSGRGPRYSRRTRFSSRRYSIRSSWWRFTQPANVRTRNCSAGGMA